MYLFIDLQVSFHCFIDLVYKTWLNDIGSTGTRKQCSSTRFDWSLGKYCGKAKQLLESNESKQCESWI